VPEPRIPLEPMISALLIIAAPLYIPPQLRGAAVGLLELLRNEGASVGEHIFRLVAAPVRTAGGTFGGTCLW
jgi:hypothetical protein